MSLIAYKDGNGTVKLYLEGYNKEYRVLNYTSDVRRARVFSNKKSLRDFIIASGFRASYMNLLSLADSSVKDMVSIMES